MAFGIPQTHEIKTWKDRIALYLSAALSPFILIPVFIFIVCFTFSRNTFELIQSFVTCFFFSTVVPFANVFIALKRNKITDIHVAELAQRREPFIVSLVSILIGTLVLHYMKVPREIVILGWVMFLNGFIFFIISLFWKISMHSSILAGIIASLMILVNVNYAWGFILLPLLIWARMHRQRHNIYQGIIAIVIAVVGLFIFFGFFGYPKW
ncbi:MAG: hypothetical protein K8T10_11760 [Candidatus Eremiobacteraeota bacterium]|nr:hypothetical protein [Candidatus Eremiobacteraeota bacterium]